MPRRHENPEPEVPEEEVRRQLERIFDEKEFQASVRRREMLRFIVEETLAGRESRLKATSIAMEVFGRGADFDQQSDPVVRLEARKLRRDLDAYYAQSGRSDPIRISIPKGHYYPRFDVENEATPDVGSAPVHSADTSQRTRGLHRLFLLSPGLLAAAFAAFAAVLFFWTSRPESSATPVASGSVQGATILVGMFDARTDDEIVALVASGLSREIAAALIRFPDVAVHLSQQQYGLVSADTPESEKPQTEFMVAGSVWREDGVLFIRADLLRRENSEVLWSERYSEGAQSQSITDILDTISSEIASVIGQQYGYVLRDVRATRLGDRNDPTLRGFACVAGAQIYRRTYHHDEYQAVRDCLEATVREDPDYVRAWAMLAYLRNDAARFGHEKNLSREEAFDLARQAAMRALDLDPRDTDALQAMSHVEQYTGDIDRSIGYARRAVETNPNDPAALANLAIRYGIAGRFDEGVPVMHRAIERSVAPPPFYYHLLAADYLIRKDWPDLLLAAERASADGWSFGQALLAIAHTELSNEQAARVAYRTMAALDPLLAEEPRAWLEAHNMPPVLIDAVADGLSRARDASGH